MEEKPILAVTMGDPAGIGPEITVKALLDEEAIACSRSVVIGNVDVLERALDICHLTAKLRRIDHPKEAVFDPNTINVIHVDNLDMGKLQYGVIQAQCGRAAFEYVDLSAKLAMAHSVDAVVTAPIHKESLKAAGVPFIGHTEMYAQLTGAKDEMTMFSVQNLKIFFLTRHVSLIEACRQIKKDNVLRGIERSLKALAQLGIASPHLAVAALNPHGGESGLFGREEMDEMVPAIEAAQAAGHRVTGPVPADSVFHMARLGRFDAVLSLYHDQGHIASKMMDFERTVSVTLGLPILRTSVDHGTAFDIAGTGQASAVSMLEAIKVAAQYAVRGVKLL